MESLIYIFLVCFVLFYPPAVLAIACYKSCMRKKKLSAFEVLACCIPLYNLAVIRKSFYDSAKIVYAALAIIVVCVAYRFVAIFLLYENALLMLASTVGMLAAMVIIWLISAFTFFDTAVCVNQGLLVKLLCILLPPLGAFIVSKAIAPYMKSVREELDGTFSNAVR